MSTLGRTFTATLQKSPKKGGWTYVVIPDSAEYFRTRAWSAPAPDRRSTVPRIGHGPRRRHPQTRRPGRPARADRQAGRQSVTTFYVDTLGFTVLRDNPTPNGGRWIELAPGDNPVVTLEPAAADVTRGSISIRFTTNDAEAAHAALAAAGVDTDEMLRWPGVPAMFAFRDPDGNAFSITDTALLPAGQSSCGTGALPVSGSLLGRLIRRHQHSGRGWRAVDQP